MTLEGNELISTIILSNNIFDACIIFSQIFLKEYHQSVKQIWNQIRLNILSSLICIQTASNTKVIIQLFHACL